MNDDIREEGNFLCRPLVQRPCIFHEDLPYIYHSPSYLLSYVFRNSYPSDPSHVLFDVPFMVLQFNAWDVKLSVVLKL